MSIHINGGPNKLGMNIFFNEVAERVVWVVSLNLVHSQVTESLMLEACGQHTEWLKLPTG